MLATRLPWKQIETAVAAKFEHQNRAGEILIAQDLFGSTETVIGAGRCWLQGAFGDALNSISCAAGYNLRWLLRAIARLGRAAVFLASVAGSAAAAPGRRDFIRCIWARVGGELEQLDRKRGG